MSAPRWTSLLWLDWRLLVNRIRTIGRSPRRLIPWVVFMVWLIPSFITRLSFSGRVRGNAELPALVPQLAPLSVIVPGLALLVIGLSVWRASSSAPAAFQSPADARFVIGAGFDSRAIFTWLALRTARRLIVSFALLLVFFQVLYLPWLGLGFTTALAFTFGIALFGAIVFGARLVAFTLQQAAPAIPIAGVGFVAGIIGGLAVLIALANLTGTVQVPHQLLVGDFAIPPGSWLVQALRGDFSGDLELFAAALVLTAGGIALAGDCYPELWAASSRAMAVRRAMRQRGGLFGYMNAQSRSARTERRTTERQVRSAAGMRVPAGALAVFWKEWLTVRRSRGGLELQVVIVAGAIALGVLMGYAMSQGSRIAGIVSGVFIVLAVYSSWAAGVQLGRDVGNPLWWLSSAALSSRLVVWSVARGLRFAVPLVAFSVATVAFDAAYNWLLPAAVLGPLLLCWMSQTVGLAVYALLPARTDYRLAMMLRMLAIYAITLPLTLAVIPGVILHNAALLVTLPVGIVAGVIIGTILFASWRIAGNGLVYAREERQ